MSEQSKPSSRPALAIQTKPEDLPEHRRNEWFAQLYAAAEELVERYPDDLDGRIRAGWWERPAEREMVAAICALRDALDDDHATCDGEPDERARAELNFHRELPAIAERLTNASRETRAWRPRQTDDLA